MKPIFLVGVICLLGVVGSANGQTVTRADSTLATDTQSQELLQAQIEVMREYDQKLLDTVYWSLGVIGGIALLLLGFGWFVNFKVYERDKRSMQQELDSTLRREIAEAKEKQDELIREAAKAIPDQIKDVVDDSLDGVRKDIETLSSNQVKSWEDFFRRFNDMEFELLELKADKWIKSKVLTNALRTLAQMIGVAQRQPAIFWRTTHTLDQMLSVVKSMKKDSFRILDTHDIRTVTEALDSVREEHGLTVTNIENIMAELAS